MRFNPGCGCCGTVIPPPTDLACCPFGPSELPSVLTATFIATGPCACLDGVSVVLTWDGSAWTGTLNTTGCPDANTTTLSLYCLEQVFPLPTQFRIDTTTTTKNFITLSCSPFHIRASMTTFEPLCTSGGSSIQLDITE